MRFLICPRDPLRSEWSRCKNSRFSAFLRCPRDPLWGSAWSRCKNSRVFAFLWCADEPSVGIVRVDVLSLWRRGIRLSLGEPSKRSRCGAVRFYCSRNGLLKLSRGLRACFLSTKVVRKVNFRSSGATFEREVHFRSSGWKIATFQYQSST